MKKVQFLALVAMLSGAVVEVSAQDNNTDNHQITVVVPNVALLDLESSVAKNFTAAFAQPTPLEAGQKVTVPNNNNDVWLNYSSIIPGSVTSRTVKVKASAVLPGVGIGVVAGAATASGKGTLGTPTALVTLTTADQSIITGIGSAYTETGAANGHQLTYSFTALDADYAALRAASTAVTVTYTLVDN